VSEAADELDPAIGRFLDAVWMERGLSSNTLAAYRADLVALARWLAKGKISLARASRADLLAFIAARVEAARWRASCPRSGASIAS
jgi:integrase/recombinase XerD